MIAAHAGRRGHNLLAALDADKLRDFAALSATLAGDEDAATLYAMVRETQFFPTHEANVRAVRVSSYEQLCGCGYRALYVTGCVDGFMPARDAFEVVSTDADRDRVREADRRTFAAGVAKATDALMFSTFSRAPLELAERTKMQVARVRMEDGERIAQVRPTCFLEEAGAGAPSPSAARPSWPTWASTRNNPLIHLTVQTRRRAPRRSPPSVLGEHQ